MDAGRRSLPSSRPRSPMDSKTDIRRATAVHAGTSRADRTYFECGVTGIPQDRGHIELTGSEFAWFAPIASAKFAEKCAERCRFPGFSFDAVSGSGDSPPCTTEEQPCPVTYR